MGKAKQPHCRHSGLLPGARPREMVPSGFNVVHQEVSAPQKCLICCRAHARLLARPSGTIACSVLALAKPQFAGDDKVHLRTTERTPMRFLALFFGFSFHSPNGSMINPDGG